MGLLGDLFQLFSSLGMLGMLAGLFVIVFFDAIVIPVGPELLAIAIFYTDPGNPLWAACIVATVVVAQVAGCTFLYWLGKNPRLLPGRMRRLMEKYRDFLMLKSENVVFVNCFVPIMPFLGAFIAISKWDYKKCMFLVALGGAIKYSLVLGLSQSFRYLFERGIAQNVSLVVVLCILVASGIYALYKRRVYERSLKG